MVVDSSALLAILLQEEEGKVFVERLTSVERKIISAPTYLESCIAAKFRAGAQGSTQIQNLVELVKIDIVDFPAGAAQIAVESYLKYGKGQGHPAQLNFGDCMSYAMSKIELMPLLFKGDDFRLTDVDCAI